MRDEEEKEANEEKLDEPTDNATGNWAYSKKTRKETGKIEKI